MADEHPSLKSSFHLLFFKGNIRNEEILKTDNNNSFPANSIFDKKTSGPKVCHPRSQGVK